MAEFHIKMKQERIPGLSPLLAEVVVFPFSSLTLHLFVSYFCHFVIMAYVDSLVQ